MGGVERQYFSVMIISTDKYIDTKKKKKPTKVTVFLTLSKEHNTSRAHS